MRDADKSAQAGRETGRQPEKRLKDIRRHRAKSIGLRRDKSIQLQQTPIPGTTDARHHKLSILYYT